MPRKTQITKLDHLIAQFIHIAVTNPSSRRYQQTLFALRLEQSRLLSTKE
jgi:hypothetical protein